MIDSSEKHIRARLVALRIELEAVAKAGNEASEVVELDQSKVGRLSRMDAMQAQAMSQASGRRRQATLRMIDAALRRLDNGEFGICTACEEPIVQKRLEFDPAAALCVECATELEQDVENR